MKVKICFLKEELTYCTVCRTGRTFSPLLNGKPENFCLVSMAHSNAMFEDETIKSWWLQQSGEAIAGKLKGTVLKEIPSQKMALGDYVVMHPKRCVLQPDSNFKAKYDSLKVYDSGTIAGDWEHCDTASWKLNHAW